MKSTEMPVPKALAQSGHKGFIYRDPYGVTLVIAPFNGPLLLSLRPAITALAAGNTCVLKLSETLPATTALLEQLVEKYFDPRAVTTVRGNREETGELLKLPFENLTPVIPELGGQNPAFVDESANIKDAARKIAWGGAWCTSPGYAYVHESVAEEFVAEAKKTLVEMYGGTPKITPTSPASSTQKRRLAWLR
ncbi:aldehyde dehydrogenase family protein [Pseudomonas sp. PCH199]|uniref:aldehyde dehydrogenase family protein n=1 Tax=unclassified Pseudomonas TaxID=196821 RepID=UPI000BD13A69|nr:MULTISPECIES: aldehyde dehydrogenase family protein [unclassified Pseudomonas]MCW8277269.1 aldehyde dehydrogenase family protein [Pseudomonas sp. PCH199]PAM82484.1 hypothetical protein CES87_18090 [Pseudomonas sp. ERMR1:02]